MINNRTIYENLLDTCEKAIKQNDLSIIKELLDKNLLSLNACNSEIIDEDEILFKILSEFSLNNM